MRAVNVLAATALVVGGLNWGLVGLANVDLVAVLGSGTVLANVVYGLVGVSALWQAELWLGRSPRHETVGAR
ncbi:MAG: DUF378 domain-containing protein [Gemmatimonadota bacterium]